MGSFLPCFSLMEGAVSDAVTPAFLTCTVAVYLPPSFQLTALKVALLKDQTAGALCILNFGFCNYGPLLLNCLT